MKRKLRIVVADDEPDMTQFLQASLTRLGHEVVTTVSSGRELVDVCREQRPDLIVTDIRMPDMDGLEAARLLYRDTPVPIIVISAYHDPAVIDRAESSHVGAFLVKPIKAAHLAPTISVVMKRFEEFLELRKETEGLKQALSDRKIIERAKGILMKEARLDEEAAFRRLQKLASSKSQKLAEVAKNIVEAAELLRPSGESSGRRREET